MALEMRGWRERWIAALAPWDAAFICSYERMFRPACARELTDRARTAAANSCGPHGGASALAGSSVATLQEQA